MEMSARVTKKKPKKVNPIWKGDGAPVDMWLLQLDLAGHSRWTAGLNSFKDAYNHRREFANRITAKLINYNFTRLTWGGDGGVYVASSNLPISLVISAGEAIHESFRTWAKKVPNGKKLAVRVSAHRARVTTADDPAYCFGSELNDFMKYERSLADDRVADSFVITQTAFVELTIAERKHWVPIEAKSVGTLQAAYSRHHNVSLSNPVKRKWPSWLEGSWFNVESKSWAYGRVVDGRPKFVYCYGGDTHHTASYDLTWTGKSLRGTFHWVDSPISGFVYLTPDSKKENISGGWWYADDVPFGVEPTPTLPRMIKSGWRRQQGKKFPAWAEKALASAKSKGAAVSARDRSK